MALSDALAQLPSLLFALQKMLLFLTRREGAGKVNLDGAAAFSHGARSASPMSEFWPKIVCSIFVFVSISLSVTPLPALRKLNNFPPSVSLRARSVDTGGCSRKDEKQLIVFMGETEVKLTKD